MTATTVRDDPAGLLEPYDFSRPAQLGREHTRQLEAAFESFARLWSSQLTAKVRVRAHLTLEDVSLVSYDEYVRTLPATTAMTTATLPERDEMCVVQFDLGSALLWVVQMMGGKSTTPPEGRAFTPIELALIRSLMAETVDHLSASFDHLLPGEVSLGAIQYNPQFLQVVSPGEPVVVASYSMRLGDVERSASVMVPAPLIVDQLSDEHGTHDSARHAKTALGHLNSTPLEVSLRLAPITIGAGEVLNLAAGDLLRLPHPETRPFELVADNTQIASAVAGAKGTRLACTIITNEENHS